MEGLLQGQKALITGGTAGIGKACAFAVAKQGASVAIFGTNAERGKGVLEELLQHTDKALFFQVDVSNSQEVDTAVKSVLEAFGSVDVLVNNAGITRDQLLIKMSEEDWDRVMEVNVKSCYNLCKAVVRPMMKSRKGKIINMSSVVGLTGNAGQVNYASSKAAIIGLTKALAKELAKRQVCVNCIAPGFIKTAMTDAMDVRQQEAVLASIPLGRMGTTDDVAQLALFLASPLSDYITGQVITVDGGMVM